VVTADGAVRVANACTHPDLFWGLKGGGGGSLGVVTRLTLRTHPLPAPEFFGAVFATVQATSDAAFRRLIGHTVRFYAEDLLNPHWGEQLVLRPENVLAINMVFQGLDQPQAEAVWRPFFDGLAGAPGDFRLAAAPVILAAPARHFWDPEFLRQVPGLVLTDDRPGAPEANVFWASNLGEAGQVLHAYQSAWLPAALLREEAWEALGDALFAATRHRAVALHTNKGLAGAPAEAVAAARDTATNPAALEAFALLICAAGGPPAYPGVPGHEPDPAAARAEAAAVDRAMREVRRLLPGRAAYVAESDFFEADWRQAFWGPHYPRLLAVKDAYDPGGLFVVHHGVGSERWSPDGFTRAG
jgi:FAD/FMN-containing dehydrogenase